MNSKSQQSPYNLGEPDELFYWGPSRAKPLYMSDFLTAVQEFFITLGNDPDMPDPPKTVTLFHEGKNVWLINENEFNSFTESLFEAYLKQDKLAEDIAKWKSITGFGKKIKTISSKELVEAWLLTLLPEFSLYGARDAINKQLSRLDSRARQKVWGAFTYPDKPSFLAKIDAELLQTTDPKAMAKKYPWIQDGYNGLGTDVSGYFIERLALLKEDEAKNQPSAQEIRAKRLEVGQACKLTASESKALDLARELAEFMDDRKAWMMQSRKQIKNPLNDVEYGWFYQNGQSNNISQADTKRLWERYINFKSSKDLLTGFVACNGGKHFISGEVAVALGPTDLVGEDKILVVPATSPTYVPMMRKAKALVTDHGGIMSHAAIVARELGLPCIVGTKQATKQLQNGDKVALDLLLGKIIS